MNCHVKPVLFSMVLIVMACLSDRVLFRCVSAVELSNLGRRRKSHVMKCQASQVSQRIAEARQVAFRRALPVEASSFGSCASQIGCVPSCAVKPVSFPQGRSSTVLRSYVPSSQSGSTVRSQMASGQAMRCCASLV